MANEEGKGFGTDGDGAATGARSITSETRLREQLAAKDARLLRFAKWMNFYYNKTYHGDWACVQCHPNSEILKNGFVCPYHDVLAVLNEAELAPK